MIAQSAFLLMNHPANVFLVIIIAIHASNLLQIASVAKVDTFCKATVACPLVLPDIIFLELLVRIAIVLRDIIDGNAPVLLYKFSITHKLKI